MDITGMGGPRLVNCPAAEDKVLEQLFFRFGSDIWSNKYIEISETTIGCLCCCVFPISHIGICYETADKYKDQNEEKSLVFWMFCLNPCPWYLRDTCWGDRVEINQHLQQNIKWENNFVFHWKRRKFSKNAEKWFFHENSNVLYQEQTAVRQKSNFYKE